MFIFIVNLLLLFLISINLHCPINYNPAEFYIRVVSNQNHYNVERISRKYHEKYMRHDWTFYDIPYTPEDSVM